jgi:Flp pilus assembly protein TadG
MITNCLAFVRRALNDQRGQVLPWVTGGMFALMGMAGLTVDIGHAYVVRAALQNGTNAAALAAAGSVYKTESDMVTAADAYASNTGEANYNPYVTGTPTVTPVCLNLLMPGHGGCTASGTNTNPSCLYVICNAVQVTQTATVPTYFLGVLGIHTIPVGAIAKAAFSKNSNSGGSANSWNIAIIEDATGSMATTDSNCPGSPSEFACALNMIQTIVSNINPCPTGMASCTPAQAQVRIALFSFPNMLTSALPNFQKAGCTNSVSSYTTPKPYTVMTLPLYNAASYTPLTYTQGGSTWQATYEFTYKADLQDPIGSSGVDANGFVSDYYQAGNAVTGNLNPNSPLVRLIGYGGTAGQPGTGSGGTSQMTGCMPIAPAGIALNGATGSGSSSSTVNTVNVGEGITYYAAAIYAAQAALTAESNLYTGSQNAMVLLSDGQANTQWIYFPPGELTQTPSANTAQPATISSTLGWSTLNTAINHGAKVASGLASPNLEGTGTISGAYPDFFDECQQAIAAAQYAALRGPYATNAAGQATKVIAVAYGAEQTGCGSGNTDAHNDVTTVVTTGLNAAFTASSLLPCSTMENIADSIGAINSDFYSDYLQSGSGVSSSCIDSEHSVSSLTGIGLAIASNFTGTTLLPSNAN